MEIGVFLRYLRCFSKIENVQINKMTLDLMRDAMLNMQVLSRTAQIIENSPKNDVDFLFDLNEQQYELQRHILCRTCYVSWNSIVMIFPCKFMSCNYFNGISRSCFHCPKTSSWSMLKRKTTSPFRMDQIHFRPNFIRSTNQPFYAPTVTAIHHLPM